MKVRDSNSKSSFLTIHQTAKPSSNGQEIYMTCNKIHRMAKNINQYQSSPDFWSQTIFKGSLLLCEFPQINALYYQHLLDKLHINWISVQKCAIFNWFAHLSKQHHKREESWFVQKARKLHDKLQWIVVYAQHNANLQKNCSPLNLSFSQMATFQRYHLKKHPRSYTLNVLFFGEGRARFFLQRWKNVLQLPITVSETFRFQVAPSLDNFIR